jgi:hypothetical protein
VSKQRAPTGNPYDEAMAARFECEQTDLQALCADRSLSTSEMFWQNDVYGGAHILKRYASVPDETPIRAIIPHGVYGDVAHDWEVQSRLPAALVYPAYRMQAYRARGILPIPSAAPFVYADKLVTYDGPREGTLFFPSHSTHWLTVEMDFERLADQLLDLPSWMQPVTVISYWRDIQLGNHLPFARRGLRVVSAGHWLDPDFLLRLAHLLRQHRHAAANAFGSSLFYGVWAGCSFHFVHETYKYTGAEEHLREEVGGVSPALAQEWSKLELLFSTPTANASQEQQSQARYYLGGDQLREPEELADLIGWLRRVDRFGRLALILGGMKPPLGERASLIAVVPFALRRSSPKQLAMGLRHLLSRCRPLRRLWRAARSRIKR